MNYKKFTDKIRPVYLINIFFLLLILGIKLNDYLSETDEYYEYASPTHTEIVYSNEASGEPFLTTHGFCFNYPIDNAFLAELPHTYKNANLSFNHLILTKFKILRSTPVYTSTIISFMQRNNIWHKSPDEEASNLC